MVAFQTNDWFVLVRIFFSVFLLILCMNVADIWNGLEENAQKIKELHTYRKEMGIVILNRQHAVPWEQGSIS